MSIRAERLACASILLALAACATTPPPAPKAEPVKSAQPPAPPPIVPRKGDVVLDLGDGPGKGTHLLRGNSLECVAQDGGMRASARDAKAADLSEVHATVRPSKGAASDFTLHATLGRPGDKASRRLAIRVAGPAASVGAGTAALVDDGRDASIRIEGRTHAGQSLKVAILCDDVVRLPSNAGSKR